MVTATLEDAVSAFGRAAGARLSSAAATGEPEDQIRGPFEGLLQQLAADAALFDEAVALGRRVVWLHGFVERWADTAADREPGPPRLPPSRRPPSPLGEIQPDSWPAEYTTELLNVLNLLGCLVDLEPAQEALLARLCAGPLVSEDELRAAGAFAPAGHATAAGGVLPCSDAQARLDL